MGDRRGVLVRVADAGVMELDPVGERSPEPLPDAGTGPGGAPGPASMSPALLLEEPNRAALRLAGRQDVIAGEAELSARRDGALVRDDVAALVGWIPASPTSGLAARIADLRHCAAQPVRVEELAEPGR